MTTVKTVEKEMKVFEEHFQWSAVKEVCRQLKGRGYQALLAGGCVRDLLMNRAPSDFDIATNAEPNVVVEMFPRALTVGREFGVTILPFQDFQIEVATFRLDLGYKDGRRPEGVVFSTAEEDALRRDFTVNALFFDPETEEIIDYVGGRADLAEKVIRAVGDADKRFEEDKLRLMRAVRFAAQLDFSIEPTTLRAVSKWAPSIGTVSRERIRDELLKLLHSPSRLRGIELLISTGLLGAAFPDSTPFILDGAKAQKAWHTRFEILGREYVESELLLALFLKPVFDRTGEKDFRQQHLKALKLDNRTINFVTFLLAHLADFLQPERIRLAELALLLARNEGCLLEKLSEIEFQTQSLCDDAKDEEKILIRSQMRKAVLQSALALLDKDRKPPRPFISGDDLKAAGVPLGPRFREILHESYCLQIEGQLLSREGALNWLKDLDL